MNTVHVSDRSDASAVRRAVTSSGKVDIVLGIPPGDRRSYAMVVESLPATGKVICSSLSNLGEAARRWRGAVIVLSIWGPNDCVKALYQLLGEQLRGRLVIAAVHDNDVDALRALRRAGAHACLIRSGDQRAMLDFLRQNLPTASRNARTPNGRVPGVTRAASEATVARAVREAHRPMSIQELATACDLSVVTTRRNLRALVARGAVLQEIQRRPVGRPASVFRAALAH